MADQNRSAHVSHAKHNAHRRGNRPLFEEGDFELTVSKGPGITLLSLRQDATFAEVKGGLAGQGWSGPVAQAPPQLRGWLGLRDQFLHGSDRKTLRYVAGNETFVFRF